MGVKISDLTAASSVADANEFEINESGTSKKVTAAQIKSYVDQTASEIKTAYESNSDTNAFTDAEKTKLSGIEASATADQTASEIRTLVESATDSNVFTDADHSKLNAIEANATADQTASEIKTAYESNLDTNAFTDADHSKLDGIAASANNYSHPNHSGEVTSTGDGATVIADDVVDEANLKVSNSPTDGYVLTARSGNTGGLTWEAASGGGGDPDLYRDNASSATTPTATGANALAIGSGTIAQGANDVVIGTNSDTGTLGDNVAIGNNARGQNLRSLAIGYNSRAANRDSIAIGTDSFCHDNEAMALGHDAQAGGQQSVALTDSYASGADSFAAAIASNSSSYGALGANSIAMGQQSKAATGQTTAIGNYAHASGVSACAIGGYLPEAEGYQSLALGTRAKSEAPESVAIGFRAKSNTTGKIALNAAEASGIGSGYGYQQRGLYVLRRATTDATQTVLSGDGATPDAANSWRPDNNSAHAFSGTIIARQDGTDGDDYAAWEVKGAIMRADNAASMVVGAAIINSLYHTSGASAWDVAIAANTTLGTCEVKVTGAASTNIDWVATIDTSEVVNP